MPTSDKASSTKDIKWTDAQIRWPDDHKEKGDDENENDKNDDENENDENDSDSDDGFQNPFDPFADPDPTQVFPFRFEVADGESSTSRNSERRRRTIDLRIHGYKTSSDEVWQSTGLTLWKASKYLCDYMVSHAVELKNKRVLELGAGLGLNGLLAHRLGARSVVITDGDSDAMVALRKNIAVNQRQRPPHNNDNDDNDNNNNNNDNNDDDNEEEEDGPTRCWDVSAAQLLWGRDHSESFLEKIANGSKFDTIIASDIVYSPLVIDPLWETVRVLLLLRRSATGATTGAATAYAAGSHVHDTRAEFWMAFAIRKVPVTIDFVLEKAREYGFDHELVDEQLDGHDYGDDNIEGDPETGKVYIYRFWWSESGIGGEEPSTTDR
eukprot:CAMPEP_0172412476 /NCGR_PEP_ID=MMETSP1061-20121228/77930_1 /TAXON_ID=37318 /ORGANISM="Pseudo-nitzschia pungens, Strain cf. pungens" /LENGTH=380 /DNA_ID=CAMNT_0013148717 /DNA_START=107 /DNA_END=1249 /DNA_ORIENTATION=-